MKLEIGNIFFQILVKFLLQFNISSHEHYRKDLNGRGKCKQSIWFKKIRLSVYIERNQMPYLVIKQKKVDDNVGESVCIAIGEI